LGFPRLVGVGRRPFLMYDVLRRDALRVAVADVVTVAVDEILRRGDDGECAVAVRTKLQDASVDAAPVFVKVAVAADGAVKDADARQVRPRHPRVRLHEKLLRRMVGHGFVVHAIHDGDRCRIGEEVTLDAVEDGVVRLVPFGDHAGVEPIAPRVPVPERNEVQGVARKSGVDPDCFGDERKNGFLKLVHSAVLTMLWCAGRRGEVVCFTANLMPSQWMSRGFRIY